MLLNILGPSAVGKTYFLRKVMDKIPEWSIYTPVVVFGDTGDEYHYNPNTDIWVHKKLGKKWCGTKEEKEPLRNLCDMMLDDRIWVVDVMRYYNGLWRDVLEAHKICKGGIRFIVPYYTGAVGKNFRQQRCWKIGKKMSPYWLSEDNCWAESKGRISMCEKHFIPAGIPCKLIEIGLDRFEFGHVAQVLLRWLENENWYENSTN